MYDVRGSHLIDTPAAPARQAEIVKDRRRPGRTHNASPALVPLLRHPTAGLVAGNLVPVDSFQIAAASAASAYPADVWLSLSAREQSAAIYREMRKLDAAYAALSLIGSQDDRQKELLAACAC
jgi:hypothetical protein